MWKSYALLSGWLGTLVGVVAGISTKSAPTFWVSLLLVCLISYVIFRDTLNLVQNVGRVYWIVRDTAPKGTPRIAKGFMRQVTPPWLVGTGIQFRAFGRTLQVGICTPQTVGSEQEGILLSVQGRLMDEEPEKIGSWK